MMKKRIALVSLGLASLLAGFCAPVVYRRFTRPATYRGSAPVITPETAVRTNDPLPESRPRSVLLPGAVWVPQTFNNCGPATVSMVLQYFGFRVSQEETKAKLRTNPDDRNVFSYEISAYLKNGYGIGSRLLYGGTTGTLKQLIANGFYVIVEDWLHPDEDIGHTTVIRGYDDEKGVFIADDSYLGTSVTYPYDRFDGHQWKPFNREYMPVYKPEDEARVAAIVGKSWDETEMFTEAETRAREEIAADNRDMYAWFNLGSSLYGLGRYEEARTAYERSAEIGWPHRMLWYQIQPVMVYNRLGDYDRAIELARNVLANNGTFAELHLELAKAYRGKHDPASAKTELSIAATYAPDMPGIREILASM